MVMPLPAPPPVYRPPRPRPPAYRNFDPVAPRAVLTNKGSPTACIFSNAEKFAQNSNGSRAFELTCSSPPGMALVQKQPAPRREVAGSYSRGPYQWIFNSNGTLFEQPAPAPGGRRGEEVGMLVLDCGISSTGDDYSGGGAGHYCGHPTHAGSCRCDKNGVVHMYTVPDDSGGDEDDDSGMLNGTLLAPGVAGARDGVLPSKCTFDNGFLQRPYDNRVLNVSAWGYEIGVNVEFIRHNRDKTGRGKTRTAHGKQGGRGWAFNSDGTLSPIEAPHLVIGMSAGNVRIGRT